MNRARAWTGAGAALALGLLPAACAHRPPAPAVDVLAARYDAGVAARAARLVALESELVLRVDGRATGRLPGVLVRALVAAPDRARLQATWLLGTAVDVCARGDTVIAWVPSRRAGLELPDAADSLGVRAPARFLASALGATWAPPHAAWRDARADSDGCTVAWRAEEGDAELRVAADGLPESVRFGDGTRAVTVRYTAWSGHGDDAWPERIEVGDEGGWLRARLEVEETHAARAARPDWFALALPPDSERLSVADLRRALSRAGRP